MGNFMVLIPLDSTMRKPQWLIDQARTEEVNRVKQPWDWPATCEICTTPKACFAGECPCDLSGEVLTKKK